MEVQKAWRLLRSKFLDPSRQEKIHIRDNFIVEQLSRSMTSGRDFAQHIVCGFPLEGFSKEDHEYWERYNNCEEQDPIKKIKKLHKLPKPLVKYDASSPILGLWRFKGTALKHTFMRLEFWILISLHCYFSILYYSTGDGISGEFPSDPQWPKVGMSLIAIPGGFIAILLPFYLNHAFSRYLYQSGNCTNAMGALSDFIVLLRVIRDDHICADAQSGRKQFFNLVVSVSTLAFSLHPHFRKEGLDRWGWSYLLEEKYLTKAQVVTLKEIAYDNKVTSTKGQLAFQEVLLWIHRGIWAQYSLGYLDPRVATTFTTTLLKIRAYLDPLYRSSTQALPLAYYHLLNLLILMYLLFLSYAFVFIAPLYSIVAFFLILLCVLGVREIANSMSEPIGHDSGDIPVFDNLLSFHAQAKKLIEKSTSYPDELESLTPSTRWIYG